MARRGQAADVAQEPAALPRVVARHEHVAHGRLDRPPRGAAAGSSTALGEVPAEREDAGTEEGVVVAPPQPRRRAGGAPALVGVAGRVEEPGRGRVVGEGLLGRAPRPGTARPSGPPAARAPADGAAPVIPAGRNHGRSRPSTCQPIFR